MRIEKGQSWRLPFHMFHVVLSTSKFDSYGAICNRKVHVTCNSVWKIKEEENKNDFLVYFIGDHTQCGR
jgi:hypothetical protein